MMNICSRFDVFWNIVAYNVNINCLVLCSTPHIAKNLCCYLYASYITMLITYDSFVAFESPELTERYVHCVIKHANFV